MNLVGEKRLVDVVIGLLAGVVATGPMTVAMIFWHRLLPAHERYPLPPRQITMKLARQAGMDELMTDEGRSAATLLAHFGYGGAVGALYGAVSARIRLHSVWKGLGFGVAVWAASYLGLLPGTGVLRGAHKHPARRNALMIGVHLLWGVTMALLTSILREEAHTGPQQPFSARNAPHLDTPEPRSE
jgi:uncharacterized membrane protein YagU involved in acid resistance